MSIIQLQREADHWFAIGNAEKYEATLRLIALIQRKKVKK